MIKNKEPKEAVIFPVELRGISKTYTGSAKKANNNISLGLRKGEILCIAGENGAGKTTLMKILGGLEAPSAGEIVINGNAASINSPLDAQKRGLGMVHQHFMLFPEYTAAENIVMGMEPRKWGIFFDGAQAKTEAAKLIEAHHFSITPDSIVKNLSVGEMQQVEICRLLYRNADIIILDEPTSVLSDHETVTLFQTLKKLAQTGRSIFLITHKLQEIKSIADRVAVLRKGELVKILEKDEIDEYAISKLMVDSGTPVTIPRKNRKSAVGDKPVIAFNNVTIFRRGQVRPLLDKVSFSVSGGEILGFTGVGGNGLGVLEAALGGFLHPEGNLRMTICGGHAKRRMPASGTITHNGKDISRLNIRRLRNQGLAYVPANRLKVGSALDATIAENMMINRRHELNRRGVFDGAAIRDFCTQLINRYTIETSGETQTAATLSGGNLQKLIVAREIDQFRDYFVFSEPTWGLDIAASGFVWEQIAALREKGAAIILISTNLDEILSLADRIIVMYRGAAAGEIYNDGAANIKETIAHYMQGLL